MKLTNAEAIQKLKNLKDLEDSENLISAVAGYRILQNIHTLHEALKPYNEMRDKIIRKYANGEEEIKRDMNPVAFNSCIKELAKIEQLMIDVDIKTFNINALSKAEFPVSIFFKLDFMIEKEE